VVCDFPNKQYGLCWIANTEKGRALQAQDEEQQRLKEQRDREEQSRQEAIRQAQARSELQARQDRQAQAVRERIAADEKRGFKHVSIKDFLLDSKTVPLGTKQAVTGFYVVYGKLEALSEAPAIRDYFPHIFILTDKAPREVRAKLLNCRVGPCRLVLMGRTAKCVITVLGAPTTTDVCLAVDDSW
jgi:hypothetical protein